MFARFRAFALSPFRERAFSWSTQDQLRAFTRGWGLIAEDLGDSLATLELQATDMRDDKAAWLQVVAAARSNDALSKKALEVLAAHNPKEHQTIIAYASRISGLF